jgi:hypothetical protein
MRAAVRDVLGDVPVQRCKWHKRENVVSYLELAEQPEWRRGCKRPTRTRLTLLDRPGRQVLKDALTGDDSALALRAVEILARYGLGTQDEQLRGSGRGALGCT